MLNSKDYKSDKTGRILLKDSNQAINASNKVKYTKENLGIALQWITKQKQQLEYSDHYDYLIYVIFFILFLNLKFLSNINNTILNIFVTNST